MKILFLGSKESKFTFEALSILKTFSNQITEVYSKKRGDKLSASFLSWEGDYIFSFESYFIIPQNLINNAKYAVNFHPASPEYPGSGCASWAIYDNANFFGVTAHLINDKVDNGRIIKVIKFPIKENETHQELTNRTKKFLLDIFKDVINSLFEKGISINQMISTCNYKNWKGNARKIKEVDEMAKIDPFIDKEELDKRIRSFHSDEFPISISIHGKKFSYKRIIK